MMTYYSQLHGQRFSKLRRKCIFRHYNLSCLWIQNINTYGTEKNLNIIIGKINISFVLKMYIQEPLFNFVIKSTGK